MANEDYTNTVGHLTKQELVDLLMSKNQKADSISPAKNSGEEKFTMRDKMRTFIESKVVAACELDEIASHDVQVKTIFNLMQGDVQ